MLIKIEWITLSCCSLLACAAEVDNRPTEPDSEPVEAVASALTGDSLPKTILLRDRSTSGDEVVTTTHGFVFRTAALKTQSSVYGKLVVENNGTDRIEGSASIDTTCVFKRDNIVVEGTRYHVRNSNQFSVAFANTFTLNASCRRDETPEEVTAEFVGLKSNAMDNFQSRKTTANAHKAVLATDNSIETQNASVDVGVGKVTSKRRKTWGSAEFYNPGPSSVMVAHLTETLTCSPPLGAPIVKTWGPHLVVPGETMTATANCPANQQVAGAVADWDLY